MVTRGVFDWLDERSFTAYGEASAAAQLAPRGPNSGADSWAAAADSNHYRTLLQCELIRVSSFLQQINATGPISWYMMMIICFFPPRYILKGSGWLGQHNNFSSLFRDKNSLLTWCLCKFCAFPAAWNSLMNLEGWKQVWIAANQMQFHPTLILLSRGSVNTPKVFISRFDCFSWGPDSI